jgi:hypothetical protein
VWLEAPASRSPNAEVGNRSKKEKGKRKKEKGRMKKEAGPKLKT